MGQSAVVGSVGGSEAIAQVLKFLFDECLHTSLVALATDAGFVATHANWLGKSGASDRSLAREALERDFVLVTNNAVDFRKIYARHEVHPGLVIFVPQLNIDGQKRAVAAMLQDVAGRDLLNKVVEVRTVGDGFQFREFDWPAPRPA